jgi:hypothetical protein
VAIEMNILNLIRKHPLDLIVFTNL